MVFQIFQFFHNILMKNCCNFKDIELLRDKNENPKNKIKIEKYFLLIERNQMNKTIKN